MAWLLKTPLCVHRRLLYALIKSSMRQNLWLLTGIAFRRREIDSSSTDPFLSHTESPLQCGFIRHLHRLISSSLTTLGRPCLRRIQLSFNLSLALSAYELSF